ncbi:hypothetical protein ACO3UB_04765 [Methanocaldococcus sp. 16A]
MPRQSNSLEWFRKAEIDYFSAFVKLWLSFNALYKRLFQNENLRKDRDYIENLKTTDNVLRRKFKRLFEENSDDGKEFRLYLGELIRIYDGGIFGGKTILKTESIKPQMNGNKLDEISFKEFIHIRSFHLQRKPRGYIKVGKIYVKNDPDEIWPYFVEILYMIRNQLIHGEMEPTDENHKIIKACYNILSILIKDEV